MPGETELHKTLKKEACRWLFRMGYRCIAAEVPLRPVGIVDAVGSGIFRPYHNCLALPKDLPQVCFVECKASRADFLRDIEEEGQSLFERPVKPRTYPAKPRMYMRGFRVRPRRRGNLDGLGKFKSCLAHPLANLHYVLAPTGIVQKKDLPPRWGLLAYGEAGVNVIVRADWQESACIEFVESSIARTLTGDIYRADARAMNSINREIFAQQTDLAQRIRAIRPSVVLSPANWRGNATAD